MAIETRYISLGIMLPTNAGTFPSSPCRTSLVNPTTCAPANHAIPVTRRLYQASTQIHTVNTVTEAIFVKKNVP